MAIEAAQLNPWVSRANMLACAGLAIAIAYVLVKMLYLFVDSSAGSLAPAVYGVTPGQIAPTQQRRVDAGAIALWHLFGEEGQQVAQPQTQEVNAPPTRLSLELQGVFVAEDEDRSTAMISEARKDSQLYRIGDKVPGNASLAAVFADRVLLSINGKLEALYFPENSMPGGMVRSAAPVRGTAPRSVSARTGRMSGGGGVTSSPGNNPGINPGMIDPQQSQEMVKALQAEIGANPDAVLGQFGLSTNNGRGYKITDTSNPALVAIGGRPGDVILTVNGQSLGDPNVDVEQIPKAMEAGGCFKVGIERNGRQFNAEACP